MKTLGTKVNDELYHLFVDSCKQRGITTSAKLRDLVENEGKFTEPFVLDKAFEHIKDCSKCSNAIIDKGYVLVSLEELKKYNIVPVRNQI